MGPQPSPPHILAKYAATRYHDLDAFFVESSWMVQCFRTLVPLGLLSRASAEDRGPSAGPDDSVRARLRARAPTCAPEPCWKSTFSCSGSGRKPGRSGTKEVCFADKRLRAPRPEALVHRHTNSFIFLFLFSPSPYHQLLHLIDHDVRFPCGRGP